MRIRFLVLLPLVFAFSLGVYGQKKNVDPVVMTIDDQCVTKSEFLRVYLKNNNDPKFDKESLDEYMDLYKKFKLKVREAEDLGYDTIPSLKRELDGYKKQLAQPYLVDTTKNNELIEEAYQRMKEEVRASHILISLDKNPSPEDTLKAYSRIMALKKRIEKGESFASVASGPGGSEDPSVASNNGDLGYFTAFQMVYPFESAAYNTPVGSISNPIRSSFGYHILKVDDRRPARGTITTAHIMVVAGKDLESRANNETAKKKIDEIYEKLQAGEEFEKLAKLYSDDPGSKNKGGVLPAFGSGTNQRMVVEFEDAAFALKENGDYSEPIKTDYGYHIIKRIDHKPIGTFEELLPQIKLKINQGDRSKTSEDSFITNLKKQYKFKDKSKKTIKWLVKNVDSTMFVRDWNAPKPKKNAVMFKYNKQKFYSYDFIEYLQKSRNITQVEPSDFINSKYKEWQDNEIMEDEKLQLET